MATDVRLLCVGSICLDTLVQVPAAGLPQQGFLSRVAAVAEAVGGGCGNTAIASSRLGGAVTVVACVGSDDAGRLIASTLDSAGVGGLIVRHDAPTGRTVVLVSSGGEERSFLYHGGTNEHVDATDCDRCDLDHFDALIVTDPFLTRIGRNSLAPLLRRARQHRLLTALDLCWDPSGEWMASQRDCWPLVDLALANVAEASQVTGCGDAATAARALVSLGAGCAVVKNGAAGLCVATEGATWWEDAIDVDCVDATGAGDWCNAGVVIGLVRTGSLPRAARLGCLAGSCAVSTLGGSTAVPTAELMQMVIPRE
jgi:ribokinase